MGIGTIRRHRAGYTPIQKPAEERSFVPIAEHKQALVDLENTLRAAFAPRARINGVIPDMPEMSAEDVAKHLADASERIEELEARILTIRAEHAKELEALTAPPALVAMAEAARVAEATKTKPETKGPTKK